MSLTLTSPSFHQKGMIPQRHTCDGLDLSPALVWHGVSEHTRSLALIVEDPDAPDPNAPSMTWVHWVLYNIPPTVQSLAEGASTSQLPLGTLEGLNDWRSTGYAGPCPSIGQHRYFYKLFALDTLLPDLQQPVRHKLAQAIRGHVLAQTELIGTYQRAE